MLGASIYLSEGIENNLNYLDKMHEAGIKTVFTSLHIPEEDPKQALKGIREISKRTHAYGMKLITDVSSGTIDQYGIENNMSFFFKDLGIKSLRMDYGFSFEDMKELSKDFNIVLNASTIDEKVCKELEDVGFDLNDITVCHNFYPREETGLDSQFFYERNIYLKEQGFKIQAFIPGTQKKRGPVYMGLPTLEKHRKCDPLEAYLDLTQCYFVDEVLIGDIAMSQENMQRINWWETEQVIALPLKDIQADLPRNFYDIHINRKDVAEKVVRSEQSRIDLKNIEINPENTIERVPGTITLDNQRYGRYMGELQVAKQRLPKDERVNVLAHIKEESLGLLQHIGAGRKFAFVQA